VEKSGLGGLGLGARMVDPQSDLEPLRSQRALREKRKGLLVSLTPFAASQFSQN
jgi:hypothetical protein